MTRSSCRACKHAAPGCDAGCDGNLWLVPAAEREGDKGATASLHSYLGEMRQEFEYSIVEAPPAGESNEATAMAQFADGIILVLSAHHTRRITARKIKEKARGGTGAHPGNCAERQGVSDSGEDLSAVLVHGGGRADACDKGKFVIRPKFIGVRG